jgi:hypothetical protein
MRQCSKRDKNALNNYQVRGYPGLGYSQFSSAPASECLDASWLGQYRFFPYPFAANYLSIVLPLHSIQRNTAWDYDCIVKYTREKFLMAMNLIFWAIGRLVNKS